MKISKLFRILFGVLILSTLGLSNEMLIDAVKSNTDTKVNNKNQENNKNNSEASIDARFSSKSYQSAEWRRKVDDGYEKGKIRTH
ncbi:hypothetical protein [Sulfurimonas sp.]|uniref:hypothetical protein n=1 Tax=Sulfurimonas sp. TaxID=2022749 RepID=UPI0025D8A80A|nr:hypothetical protein [Sulfurimonas sp.]